MSIKVNGKFVAGSKGEDGASGKSAYEYALDGGYTGTEAEFQELMGTGPWLPLNGGKLTGSINMNNCSLLNARTLRFYAPNPVYDNLVPSLPYYGFYLKSKEIFLYNGSSLAKLNVGTPSKDGHAANKKYVDDSIKAAITDSWAAAY